MGERQSTKGRSAPLDLRNVIWRGNSGNFGTTANGDGSRSARASLSALRVRRQVPAALVGCRAGGRYVGARANIVVLSQTTSAKMKLVDLALNYRSFAPTQVTTASNPLAGSSRLPS